MVEMVLCQCECKERCECGICKLFLKEDKTLLMLTLGDRCPKGA